RPPRRRGTPGRACRRRARPPPARCRGETPRPRRAQGGRGARAQYIAPLHPRHEPAVRPPPRRAPARAGRPRGGPARARNRRAPGATGGSIAAPAEADTMTFRELDYYGIDELYTDEERMARDTVRAFVQAEVMPEIGKHFTAGTFPSRLIPRFGELGLLGASLSGYGCPGMSATAYGLICQELERGDSGIRSFCSVQSSLVMYPIWAFGSEEQKQRYLPEMAAGRVIGCFGLTEPDFGSNPAGMLTTAVKTAGGYRL